MRADLTIESTEPQNFQDLASQIRQFRAAAHIVGAQNRERRDVDELTAPFFNRVEELEILASDFDLLSFDDILSAIDVYQAMISPEGEYLDRRDALLLQSIRDAVLGLRSEERRSRVRSVS